jgi:hypothetical protein
MRAFEGLTPSKAESSVQFSDLSLQPAVRGAVFQLGDLLLEESHRLLVGLPSKIFGLRCN